MLLTLAFAYMLLVPFGLSIALRWLAAAFFGLLLLFASVWANLDRNRTHVQDEMIPRLGAGTTLSILRGAMIVWLAGFLTVPRPSEEASWIPGLIFTAAVGADFFDGYLARRQGMVTRLGQWLDINLDGVAVLTAILVSIHLQTLPLWYLAVGLARFIFLAGIWLRVRLGRPVYGLQESPRRRSLAGVQMIFLCLVLLPVFDPRVVDLLAVVIAAVFLGSFAYDWLEVSGRGDSAWLKKVRDLWKNAGGYLPIFARLLTASVLLIFAAAEIVQVGDRMPLGWIAFLELLLASLLILGAAGRAVALAILLLAGLGLVGGPTDRIPVLLILCSSLVFFTGTGGLSLWTPENWLVYHRAGRDRTPEAGQ
jgi:CDP-diacylglycerol--glycerol-3-phosphate 3-phosphatidyltransferase